MKRYTIYYKFLEEFLPMINCADLKDIARHPIAFWQLCA